ncbi:MAG: 4-hydroxy-tetrahydrodipicolinate reductase [Bacteroidales bacterium]|jgi:4-hydroxy-tetrahydrodipicolinate reductase|nr:4-hydroxy-tetrahydrodipicolinate reductase [Bacteroidales bacterium]
MNIALIGYGKMGKMVESIAVERGHRVVLKIDIDNLDEFTRDNLGKAQVAIEFTKPETAFANVTRCIEYGVPVVSGSTGWYSRLEEAKKLCTQHNGSMLCTSNFSLGVNVFFEINRRLARIMNRFPDYTVDIEETHHTQKLDAPSGTAITLAEGVMSEMPRIKKWELDGGNSPDALPIHAVRRENVPGTHHVKYSSEIDDIEIIHTAHNRKGLALGAVMAAEYIHDRKGIFTMNDFLEI